MKIEKHVTEGSLDIKRCYLPFTVTSCCPSCKVENRADLNEQYLSYPNLGKPEEIWFMCHKCDHEWAELVILTMEMTPVPAPPTDAVGKQVYLDRDQCKDFELEYVPADTDFTIAADALLKSKGAGYDDEHRELLGSLAQRTLELKGTGHGWFTIERVR